MRRAVKRRAGRFVVDRLERRQLLAAALVKDILPGTGGSTLFGSNEPVNSTVVLNNALLFTANDGSGFELWRTDGTAAGTQLVKDISTTASPGATGPGSSSPANFLATGDGRAFFTATTAENGRELWVTDGTAAGTRLFADVNTSASPTTTSSSSARPLAMVGGRLYFTATGDLGSGLYRTDAAGTGVEFVGAITRTSTAAGSVAVYGDRLYLTGSTSETGTELFRTTADGTGIELVKDIYGGINGSAPANLTVFDGKLYFTAATANEGIELWSTDGTTTALVQDLEPATGKSSAPSFLTVLGDRLYFRAGAGTVGTELYALTAGTSTISLVADVSPGAGSGTPQRLTVLNGSLIFSANSPGYGVELHRYDPATDQVTPVGDVNVGTDASSPQPQAVVGNTLFFSAADPIGGTELYQTNGTPETTFRVRDINPGASSSSPAALGVLNGQFLFTANEPATGSELWAATPGAAPALPVVSGSTLTVIGTAGDDTLQVRTDTTTNEQIVSLNGRTLRYGGITQIDARLSGGNDRPLIEPLVGASLLLDGGDGFENVTVNGSAGADTIDVGNATLALNGAAWVQLANADVLYVNGLAGSDLIRVGPGGSGIIDAGADNDTLDATAATRATSLFGGTGNDTFFTRNNIRDGIDGGAGTDTATVDADEAATTTAVETLIVPNATGAIRGVVFNDLDADGVRDAGEPGLANWTVSITAGPNGARSTTTDASGAYAFTQLADGQHVVTVPLPAGWQHAGATTNQVILNGGNSFDGINFAPTQRAIVAGYAYNDTASNGVYDISADPVVPGTTVYLDNDGDSLFDANEPGAVADANGWYRFSVPAGTSSKLKSIAPAGYRSVFASAAFSAPSTAFYRRDVALTDDVIVSGRVFLDDDRDGVRDANETGGLSLLVYADLNGNGAYDANEPYGGAAGSGDYSITLPGPGTYTFRTRLDLSGYAFSGPDSFTLTLAGGQISSGNNVATYNTTPPTIYVNPTVATAAPEGAATRFNLGSFDDYYRDGPWTVSFDYGDGTSQTRTQFGPGSLGTLDHVYADNGSYTAALTITDAFGGSTRRTLPVNVANANPTLTLTPEATAYRPGSIVRATAAATDVAADAGSLSFSWRALRDDGLIAGQGTGPDVAFFAAEAGTYTITMGVSDKDGGGATATATITVGNLPPTLSLTPAAGPVSEGGTVVATGAASDPDGDALTYAWTATYEDVLVASGNGADVSFAAADDGDYVIRMTATDPYGAAAEATKTVTVGSLPPTVALSPSATSVKEGEAVTVTANVSDVPADQAAGFGLTWAVTRNGTIVANQVGGTSFTYTPTRAGAYVVSLTAVDKDGTAGVGTTNVSVANVAPTVTLTPSAASVNEGQSFTVTASATDIADDVAAGLAYAWTATRDGWTVATQAGGTSLSFKPTIAGTYIVTATVTDQDGEAGTATTSVVVVNVPPTAAIVAPAGPFVEGQTLAFDATVTDTANDLATLKYAWTVERGGAVVATGTTKAFSFVADRDGAYVVRLTVTDDNGASAVATAYSFTAANVAPTATITGTSANPIEGQPVTLSGLATDPGRDDALFDMTWTVTRNGTTVFTSSTTAAQWNATWTVGDSGTYVATLRAVDSDGAASTATHTFTVANLAPAVTISGPTSVKRAKPASFTFSAYDVAADTSAGLTYQIDWDGDGRIDQTVRDDGSLTLSYKYANKGSYNLTVFVTDKDGGVTKQTRVVSVS